MIRKAKGRVRGVWERAVAGLLTLILLCGLLPAVTHEKASASDWAQEYLDQVVAWDVMRGDTLGDLYPTRNITRAEFAAMINRAYGYTQKGPTPFTDVDAGNWYADDIAIAYTAGYLTGTSPTTASPNAPLTREQAVVILARNMMFEENAGEVLGFTDSRSFSEWSHSYIRSAIQAGLIGGYDDGSFRPQNNITREEVAAVLVRAIGTLIKEPGEQSLGSVYGNVVINTSGVTLRDTTIAGDLYLTGGIGLGDVLLENVNVLGRIVVSGAGESNKGDSSVILRNVTSNQMVVDSAGNQFVTIRAEGDTSIKSTSVRTAAYLDDATADGKGLLYIELDGEDGTNLQLAGNVKEVLNMTPDSHILVASGSVQKITVDEQAVDSSMAIESGAVVRELNLDVGTSVSGSGDVEKLTVNAAGCTVSMLPDQITIRPGLTANINGMVMDSQTAAEISLDPRLTAGYPTVKEIAPSTATAVFSTNKMGTIYWAITALADGSTSEDDLISPPVYGGTILQSGTIDAASSKTEYTAALTDLVSDGSYYVTSVMVDSKGQHSPVKVTAFTTPDDTMPAFTTPPTMTRVSTASSQVTVMPNKSCLMYYALLPKDGVAPTPADFKAASITGNLGYGSVDVTKNTTLPVEVNNVDLDELTDYTLYLWLTDYDNAKSSTVVSVPFKTADETAPTITYMSQTDAQEKTITMTFALDEPGTLYWAVVKSGDTFLRPITGQSVEPGLDDEAAIIQTTSGVGALQKGSVAVKTGDTDYSFTISNLTGETSYDLYYIARDSAGNYSLDLDENGISVPMVKKTVVSTLDTNPPTVTQEFTKYNGDDTATPLPDTNIRLVFNENIQGVDYNSTPRTYDDLLTLYQQRENTEKLDQFVTALRRSFTLYQVVNGRETQVEERTKDNATTIGDDWVIDYRKVMISQEDGKMVVTFPTSNNSAESALNLAAGATYFFRITENSIADMAMPPNLIRSSIKLDTFRTVYAQVNLSENETSTIEKELVTGTTLTDDVRVDMAFVVDPTSVERVAATERWDILLWSDIPVTFNVYRYQGTIGPDGALIGTGTGADADKWKYLGEGSIVTQNGASRGISLIGDVITPTGQQPEFGELRSLTSYVYAIEFTRVNGRTTYDTFSDLVTMKIAVAASGANSLGTLANNVNGLWDSMTAALTVSSIGVAYNGTTASDRLELTRQFTDRTPPSFMTSYPEFTPDSTAVSMDLGLDRTGTVYYVIAPKGVVATSVKGDPANIELSSDNDSDSAKNPTTYVLKNGGERDSVSNYAGKGSRDDEDNNLLVAPDYLQIVNPNFSNRNVITGWVDLTGGASQPVVAPANSNNEGLRLLPNTDYYVYFVIKGVGASYSEVSVYQFKTKPVSTPLLTIQGRGETAASTTSSAEITTNMGANVWYALVDSNRIPAVLSGKFETGLCTAADLADADFNSQYGDYAQVGDQSTITKLRTALGQSATYSPTVLDAMLTVMSDGSGRSYFDVYANATLRQNVLAYINGTNQFNQSEAPLTRSTLTTVANVAKMEPFADIMVRGTEYILVGAAQDLTGASGFGYKAIRALYRPDTDPPQYSGGDGSSLLKATVTSDSLGPDFNWVYNANDVTGTSNSINQLRNATFNGSVLIGFDKELYQLESTTLKKVVTGTAGSGQVSITDIVGYTGDGGSISITSSGSGATNTYTIRFTGIRAGTQITLFTSGSISNADGYSTTKKLTLTFDPTLLNSEFESGIYLPQFTPGFRVTWQ